MFKFLLCLLLSQSISAPIEQDEHDFVEATIKDLPVGAGVDWRVYPRAPKRIYENKLLFTGKPDTYIIEASVYVWEQKKIIQVKEHTVKIVGKKPPGPTPPPPGPNPNPPPTPLPATELSEVSKQATYQVQEPARSETIDKLITAQQQAAKFAGTEQPVEAIITEWKKLSSEAFGSNLQAWAPWRSSISKKMTQLQTDGKLTNHLTYAKAFAEIASGLIQAKTISETF